MELDLTGIHKLAAEQGIDPGTLDDALAEALRLAYLKTPHAARHARVELDERSGNFTVWAADEIPVEPTEDNLTPFPSWARNTMTPRVTSAVSPQPPHARSSPSCSAAPKMRRYSVRSPARRASSSPASSSRMLPTPPTCMSRWAMSKPFCLAVSRCPANVTATANASACTW